MPVFPEITELFATRIHKPNQNLSFIGKAEIGSVDSGAVWQIQRITVASKVTSFLWANGNDEFTNVWDDRESLSYS